METWARNGSGYYDDTAYKAIKSLERKEDKNMMDNYRRGDVIEYDTPSGKHIVAAVVSSDEYNSNENTNTVVTCMLTDKYVSDVCVPLMFRDKKYINCGSFGNVYKNQRYPIVKELSYEEMREVDKALQKQFDIVFDMDEEDAYQQAAIDMVNELKCALAMVKAERDDAVGKCVEYEHRLAEAKAPDENMELVKITAERDVYKELYMNLIGMNKK